MVKKLVFQEPHMYWIDYWYFLLLEFFDVYAPKLLFISNDRLSARERKGERETETYGFNVDFVNKELPPLPATDSVRNNNMSDRHSQRAYEQTCFYSSSVCSPSKTRRNTEHIRSFQRHKNQRQYRTERCNPQIRPSRQPRSIAQTINA